MGGDYGNECMSCHCWYFAFFTCCNILNLSQLQDLIGMWTTTSVSLPPLSATHYEVAARACRSNQWFLYRQPVRACHSFAAPGQGCIQYIDFSTSRIDISYTLYIMHGLLVYHCIMCSTAPSPCGGGVD